MSLYMANYLYLDHGIMKENLNYFVTLTEMDRSDLVDLEQPVSIQLNLIANN